MWKISKKQGNKTAVQVENFCIEKWKKREKYDKKFSTGRKRIFNRKNVEKEKIRQN